MTLKERIEAAFGSQAEFSRLAGVNKHTVKRWVLAGEICQTTVKGLMAHRMIERRMKKHLSAQTGR